MGGKPRTKVETVLTRNQIGDIIKDAVDNAAKAQSSTLNHLRGLEDASKYLSEAIVDVRDNYAKLLHEN